MIRPSHELERGLLARGLRIGDRLQRVVEHTHSIEPPENVVAAVGARQPDVPADGENDGPAVTAQFVGELHPRRGAADDEDTAIPQVSRAAIGRGRHLMEGGWNAIGPRRHRGPVAIPRGNRDHRRHPEAPAGRDDEAARRSRDALDDRPLFDGRRKRIGIAREEVDHLVDGHESVRIGSRIREVRQSRLPVWREQAERLPPLAAPALGDPAALEYDVADAAVDQAATQRESCLTGADHDGFDLPHHTLTAPRRRSRRGRPW